MQATENIHATPTRRPSHSYDDFQIDIDNGSIEVMDPYNPSISLQIQNRLRKSTVNSVDELDTTSCLAYTPVITRSTRSSFERHRSFRRQSIGGRGSMENPRNLPEVSPMEERRWPQSAPPLHHGSLFRHAVSRRGAMDVPYDPEAAAVFGAPTGASVPLGPSPHVPPHTPRNVGTRQASVSSRSVLSAVYRLSPLASYSKPLHEENNGATVVGAHSMESFMQPTTTVVDLERGPDSLSSSMRSSPIIGARDKGTPLRLYIATFLTVIVPQQIYLHLLLRLPYMYHSRVTQILLDANLTLEQMKALTLWDSVDGQPKPPGDSKLPRAYMRLKKNWESFIDNVLREWKTLNIISGLLLSGILTIFQIEGANSDPITRYMAFWSLISALLSLMYGCFFIIRFSNMRRVYKATEWAIEAQKKQTMFWNVWVMLSMPAIWLVWSIIAYIACIMSFMWRARPNEPNAIIHPRVRPATDTGFRFFICCVLGVGVLYAILIINTLRHYGSKMDRTWSRRIAGYRRQQEASIHRAEASKSHPTQSPPIQFGQIIPPTPPQQFAQRLSSSPPVPSSPPFAAPASPSPLAERRFNVPLYSGEAWSRSPSDNEHQSPPIALRTILNDSRQRLSPDPDKQSSFNDDPDSPNTVESNSSLPVQNGALGLFIPEEPLEPPSPRPNPQVFNMVGLESDPQAYDVDAELDSRSRSSDSPSEGTGSTLIQDQREAEQEHCAREDTMSLGAEGSSGQG